MAYTKIYCLRCEQTSACSCGNTDKHIRMSDRLRPPKNTKNKARFREFLDACHPFSNCVPDDLIPDFLRLLAKVKHEGWHKERIEAHLKILNEEAAK